VIGVDQQQNDDEAFLRQWTLPEEDRRKYTTRPWAGEFRWFRSPNVVPLEQWRRSKASETRPVNQQPD
jgi:hypothetical protein